MTTSTSPSLEEQVTRLQARIDAMEGDRRQTSRRRGIRMALGVFTIAAMLLIPVGAFALDSFTDVPSTNTYYTQIERVKGAGITAGCTATKFCPNDNVTRGQMAAFLARTGGRADADINTASSGPVLSGAETSLGTVTIKAGDVTGGYAVVQLIGSIGVYAQSTTGLPTYAVIYIREVGSVVRVSNYGYAQVDQLAEASFGSASATVIGSATVPTGVAKTYELIGFIAWGTGALHAMGSISGTYVPFAGTGANALPVVDAPPKPAKGPSSLGR